MMNLIKAEKLSLFCGNQALLDDVSLNIDAGDFITIVGPNGAGKSLLLKCLMGFYTLDRGKVWRRSGLRVGYVPQRFSVESMIPINVGSFLTLNKTYEPPKLQQVVEEVGINEILGKGLAALSSGELQRLLLARALLGSPQLLILDEPAQNLDITHQAAFYKLLNRIYNNHESEQGISILMVSHDLHFVLSSTRRVVCLFHHICCSGEPQQIAHDPAFISLFGEDAQSLLAVYTHLHDHSHEGDSKGAG